MNPVTMRRLAAAAVAAGLIGDDQIVWRRYAPANMLSYSLGAHHPVDEAIFYIAADRSVIVVSMPQEGHPAVAHLRGIARRPPTADEEAQAAALAEWEQSA